MVNLTLEEKKGVFLKNIICFQSGYFDWINKIPRFPIKINKQRGRNGQTWIVKSWN